MDRPIWVCFNFALIIDWAQARHMGKGDTRKHTYPNGICHQNISWATRDEASSPNTPVIRIYFTWLAIGCIEPRWLQPDLEPSARSYGCLSILRPVAPGANGRRHLNPRNPSKKGKT